MSPSHPHLRVISVSGEAIAVHARGDRVVSCAPHLHQEHTPEEAERYARSLLVAAREARRARNHAPESEARCPACGSDEAPVCQPVREQGRVVGVVVSCPRCGERRAWTGVPAAYPDPARPAPQLSCVTGLSVHSLAPFHGEER